MSGDLLDCAGHVGKIVGAIGAECANVIGCTNRMMHDWAFAGLKLERQAHGLQRKQQVGKDDGGIHTELLRGGDRDLGGDFGLLADFHQSVMFANVPVFLHVAPGLAEKPYRGAINGAA